MVKLVAVVKGRFTVTPELMAGSLLMFGCPKGCSPIV
jgi:hypothetical protein